MVAVEELALSATVAKLLSNKEPSIVAAATAFSGGTVSGNTFVPTSFGGSASTNINGQDGVFSLTPFYSTGGGGGATQIGLPGGNGGRGAIGSGGGGAGAGSTRGRSGDGGRGLVIINCW